ncbi:MAG: chemotaxis protein CheW [Armatimonadetes bacterium]|nr:chemotaxis protein CheW [Armatimonadota bacterium]
MSELTNQDSDQYLTFTLGEEGFAIEISKIREVLDFTDLTTVPRTPDYMRGVINLRGNVVPIVDLRLQLGMSAVEKTVDTCIVIVEVDMGADMLHVGMLADSVQEVVDIDHSQIEPAPKMGTRLNTEFIRGMAKRDDKFSIILDIDKVLSGEELAAMMDTKEEEAVAA